MKACRDCGTSPALWSGRCYRCDKGDLVSPAGPTYRPPEDRGPPPLPFCHVCTAGGGQPHEREEEKES